MLNRTAGGIGSYETNTDDESMAKLSVVANRKIRNLIDFLEIDKLKQVVSEADFKYYLKRYPELTKKL